MEGRAGWLEWVGDRDNTDLADRADRVYRRALALWAETAREGAELWRRVGAVQGWLAELWRARAKLARGDRHWNYWQVALEWFEQAIQTFRDANETSAVAARLKGLNDCLYQLQRWEALRGSAQQIIELNDPKYPWSNPFLRAQGFGSLVKICLVDKDWQLAEDNINRAFECLGSHDSLRPEHSNLWAWLMLSRSKVMWALGNTAQAFEDIESAYREVEAEPENGPRLVVAILNQARTLFYESGNFEEAFKLKRSRRSIEQQFRLKAFVGAGQVRAVRRERLGLDEGRTGEKVGAIAEEIEASGRAEDLRELMLRLENTETRLTVICGFSGVGKSSLVSAGLIPAIAAKRFGNLVRRGVPVVVRRYEDWRGALWKALEGALAAREMTLPIAIAENAENLSLEERFLAALRWLDVAPTEGGANAKPVLILDQFEDFFTHRSDRGDQEPLFRFLGQCLEAALSLDIVMSIRRDYVFHLLDWPMLARAAGDGTLSDQALFLVDDFSRDRAIAVMERLCDQVDFGIDAPSLAGIVDDLAIGEGESAKVRPIELQLVGAQLEAQKLRSLAAYQQAGGKLALVKNYLDEVRRDCGPRLQGMAGDVLVLLVGDARKGLRPAKGRSQLRSELAKYGIAAEEQDLAWILKVLVGSGIAFELPGEPEPKFQLVHDYLAEFIRDNEKSLLQQQWEEAKEQREQAERSLAAVMSQLELAETKLAAVKQEADLIQKVSRLERLGNVALKLRDPFDGLQRAMEVGLDLKALTTALSPADYPAKPPMHALDQLLNTPEFRTKNQFENHQDRVWSASFSPDGKTIVTASGDGTAKLWDCDGNELQTLTGHQGELLSASFSPDGKTIVTASEDGTAKLWDLEGNELQTLTGHQGWVRGASFSPDGNTIVTASEDGTAKLWDRNGKELQTLTGHQGGLLSASFSPDGKTIVTASEDGTAKLWDLEGNELQTLTGHKNRVWSASFSLDGKTIVTTSSDGTAKLWDLEGNGLQTLTGHKNEVWSASFSPNSKTIVTASGDGTAKLWDLEGNELQTLTGHKNWVWNASFSPDGNTIVTASDDGTAKLWDRGDNELQTLTSHQNEVWSASFSPDGNIIVTASNDGTAKLWDFEGNELQTLTGHKSEIWSAGFSPDGNIIVTASNDDTAKLWDLEGNELQTLTGHKNWVWSASFSPNGNIIVTASSDGTAKLWDLEGNELQTLTGHQDWVRGASFSPDGKTIATASDDDTAKLWDLEGNELQTLTGHKNWVWSASFSPNGNIIVTASSDGTAKLWDLEGNELQTLTGHKNWVWSASFSPDGKTIVTASNDRTAKLWDLEGNEIQTLNGHQGSVRSASFSPDGNTILTASDDRTAKLWPVETLDSLLAKGCDWLRDYLTTNPNAPEKLQDYCNVTPKRPRQDA